jgi:hypothetical protein
MLSGSEKILVSSVQYNDLSTDSDPFLFENKIPVELKENGWFSFFKKKEDVNINF